jgi:hypothetical protein
MAYAPLVSYAWRILLNAPLVLNAPLATADMRHWYFIQVQKKLIFSGIYTQQYTRIYIGIKYNCRIHSMQYKTNISSSQTIRTIIVTKFPNIRSVGAYIAQVHASHTLHTLHITTSWSSSLAKFQTTKRPSRLLVYIDNSTEKLNIDNSKQ